MISKNEIQYAMSVDDIYNLIAGQERTILGNSMLLHTWAEKDKEWKNKEAAYQGTVHSLEHKIWAMKDEIDALKRDNERINKEYFNLNRNLELSSKHVGDLKKERDQWQIWHNEAMFKFHDENAELKKKVESYENCIKMTQSYFDSLDYERMPAPNVVWIPTPNTSKEDFDKLKEEFRQRIRDAYLKSTFDFSQFDIQKVIDAYNQDRDIFIACMRHF